MSLAQLKRLTVTSIVSLGILAAPGLSELEHAASVSSVLSLVESVVTADIGKEVSRKKVIPRTQNVIECETEWEDVCKEGSGICKTVDDCCTSDCWNESTETCSTEGDCYTDYVTYDGEKLEGEAGP